MIQKDRKCEDSAKQMKYKADITVGVPMHLQARLCSDPVYAQMPKYLPITLNKQTNTKAVTSSDPM